MVRIGQISLFKCVIKTQPSTIQHTFCFCFGKSDWEFSCWVQLEICIHFYIQPFTKNNTRFEQFTSYKCWKGSIESSRQKCCLQRFPDTFIYLVKVIGLEICLNNLHFQPSTKTKQVGPQTLNRLASPLCLKITTTKNGDMGHLTSDM